MRLFNFGRNNRLSLAPIVADDDYSLRIGYWLSGRVFGYYVSVVVRSRRRSEAKT